MPKDTKRPRKGAVSAHKVQHTTRQRRAYALPGELALDAEFYAVPAPQNTPSPTAQNLADDVLDTIELKRTENDAVERAKKARKQCREVAFVLNSRTNIQNLECSLGKAAKKIENCAVWGAYQHLSDEVNYKVGTALCKNRLCPNCQRVLSAKRKANFLDWFELNRPAMRRFFFYHLVLTVRHDAVDNIRNNLYTSELLKYFAALRGTDKNVAGWRERRAWWDEKVAGGIYSTEIKAGRDTSPHIHIHVLLVARGQLWNGIKESQFKMRAREEWAVITKDTLNGVFIDPVYYLDDNRERVNCHFGTTVDVERGIAECMKYTLKSDAASLSGYSDEFLNELLTFRNRYYGRFGILTPKCPESKKFTRLDMLCTDYKDLDQLSREELARLFDPTTGEVKTKEQTKIVLTPARNVRAHTSPVTVVLGDGATQLTDKAPIVRTRSPAVEPAPKQSPSGGETYYSLIDSSVQSVVTYNHDERDQARRTLAGTLKRKYDPSTDLL